MSFYLMSSFPDRLFTAGDTSLHIRPVMDELPQCAMTLDNSLDTLFLRGVFELPTVAV